MMHSDTSQQNAFQNSQQHQPNTQILQQLAQWLQQAQHHQGQQGFGQGAFGQGIFGGGQSAGPNWGGQRQLSPQDINNVLQQIASHLPQILAQAQQQSYQPLAAYGGFGGHQRNLSQQDINEIVRQIFPVLPNLLQSAQQQQGFGPSGFGQTGFGWQGSGAYGGQQQNAFPQRQVSQKDAHEIARQLAEVLAYGQTGGQQRF